MIEDLNVEVPVSIDLDSRTMLHDIATLRWPSAAVDHLQIIAIETAAGDVIDGALDLIGWKDAYNIRPVITRASTAPHETLAVIAVTTQNADHVRSLIPNVDTSGPISIWYRANKDPKTDHKITIPLIIEGGHARAVTLTATARAQHILYPDACNASGSLPLAQLTLTDPNAPTQLEAFGGEEQRAIKLKTEFLEDEFRHLSNNLSAHISIREQGQQGRALQRIAIPADATQTGVKSRYGATKIPVRGTRTLSLDIDGLTRNDKFNTAVTKLLQQKLDVTATCRLRISVSQPGGVLERELTIPILFSRRNRLVFNLDDSPEQTTTVWLDAPAAEDYQLQMRTYLTADNLRSVQSTQGHQIWITAKHFGGSDQSETIELITVGDVPRTLAVIAPPSQLKVNEAIQHHRVPLTLSAHHLRKTKPSCAFDIISQPGNTNGQHPGSTPHRQTFGRVLIDLISTAIGNATFAINLADDTLAMATATERAPGRILDTQPQGSRLRIPDTHTLNHNNERDEPRTDRIFKRMLAAARTEQSSIDVPNTAPKTAQNTGSEPNRFALKHPKTIAMVMQQPADNAQIHGLVQDCTNASKRLTFGNRATSQTSDIMEKLGGNLEEWLPAGLPNHVTIHHGLATTLAALDQHFQNPRAVPQSMAEASNNDQDLPPWPPHKGQAIHIHIGQQLTTVTKTHFNTENHRTQLTRKHKPQHFSIALSADAITAMDTSTVAAFLTRLLPKRLVGPFDEGAPFVIVTGASKTMGKLHIDLWRQASSPAASQAINWVDLSEEDASSGELASLGAIKLARHSQIAFESRPAILCFANVHSEGTSLERDADSSHPTVDRSQLERGLWKYTTPFGPRDPLTFFAYPNGFQPADFVRPATTLLKELKLQAPLASAFASLRKPDNRLKTLEACLDACRTIVKDSSQFAAGTQEHSREDTLELAQNSYAHTGISKNQQTIPEGAGKSLQLVISPLTKRDTSENWALKTGFQQLEFSEPDHEIFGR